MPRGRVEFMHQMDGLDTLDRYFTRQSRRYQTFRIPEGLTTVFVLERELQRSPRAILSESVSMGNSVLAGYYYRITDTFLTYGGSEEQTFMARHANTLSVRETLEQSALVIRNSYVHDTDNMARNVEMCQSNNYWNIRALNTGSPWSSSSYVMCLGCGIGGTINRLDRGINR